MASPQLKPDPSQRPSGDLGLHRVEREVGKGRAFAWWWIFVLVVIAAIVWWAGWGRTNRTPATHRTAPAASAPAASAPANGTAHTNQPQPASRPGTSPG